MEPELLVFGVKIFQVDHQSIWMTNDRLIIEVVYMVFRAAIAIYLSLKVLRHQAVSAVSDTLA